MRPLQKIMVNPSTTIRQTVLNDKRIGVITNINGHIADFKILMKRNPLNRDEYIYKKAQDWNGGIKNLFETIQTYASEFVDKNTKKFSDKFVIKENDRNFLTFIKNYNNGTVKMIKEKKDIWGNMAEKEVFVYSPSMGLENIRPTKSHIEELQRDSYNAFEHYKTEFRHGRPYNSYCEKKVPFSMKMMASDSKYIDDEISVENLPGSIRDLVTENLRHENIEHYYKNGIRLLNN